MERLFIEFAQILTYSQGNGSRLMLLEPENGELRVRVFIELDLSVHVLLLSVEICISIQKAESHAVYWPRLISLEKWISCTTDIH